MDNTPQISVLMPVYNGERYIYAAIESILKQSYKDFELLILLEYGSNESSKEIVYAFTDTRIRVIENEKKLGLSSSLNQGIELARGKYIARMDADDISYSERFRIQKEYLDKHSDISLCGTAMKINGKNVAKKLCQHEGIIFYSYLYCPFFHPTVMWRREDLLEKNLKYKEGIAAEDYELWMRVIEQVKTANIPKPLLMYRMYGNNRSDIQREKLISENENMLREYWERNGLQYEVPESYISAFSNLKIIQQEWRLKELSHKTSNFKEKCNMIQKMALDLYMIETLNIGLIFDRYCELFLDLYGSLWFAKIRIFSYCIFRVTKRKVRLLLERMLSK